MRSIFSRPEGGSLMKAPVSDGRARDNRSRTPPPFRENRPTTTALVDNHSWEQRMPAYVVITREKTRNQAQLDQYKSWRSPIFKKPRVVFRARHCRQEVLEGSAAEEILILEFPSYEDAKAW